LAIVLGMSFQMKLGVRGHVAARVMTFRIAARRRMGTSGALQIALLHPSTFREIEAGLYGTLGALMTA
jgi:hypothetical protein